MIVGVRGVGVRAVRAGAGLMRNAFHIPLSIEFAEIHLQVLASMKAPSKSAGAGN